MLLGQRSKANTKAEAGLKGPRQLWQSRLDIEPRFKAIMLLRFGAEESQQALHCACLQPTPRLIRHHVKPCALWGLNSAARTATTLRPCDVALLRGAYSSRQRRHETGYHQCSE